MVVDEYEALDAVVAEAAQSVEENVEECLVAVCDGARELHVVGAVPCPRWVEADAVRLLSHVVDELGDTNAVAAEWEVDGMLLDRADTDDDRRRRIVGEPVLEGRPRQLPEPEPG